MAFTLEPVQPVSIHVIEQWQRRRVTGKGYNLSWATFLFTSETLVHYVSLLVTPDLLGLLIHCREQGTENLTGNNYEGVLG